MIYILFYNEIDKSGLIDYPKDKSDIENNVKIYVERLNNDWKKIIESKLLDNIEVHKRFEDIGTATISGSLMQIEKLKQFVHDNRIGTVVKNDVIFRAS